MNPRFVLHPGTGGDSGTDPADPAGETPDVRIHNVGDALAAAAGELAEFGLTWKPPEAVDSLGVLGYRLWFTSGPPGDPLPGPRPVDVRPDGEVRFFTH